uniref:Uncharacterized protein n=1 Tax=Spongospora subterranea TaxID=70186 RepID=A0A0H5QZ75_9EUKA|eukprot:CRZ00849.1 hypothetical protein [Spongospora subterranea]
MPVSEECLVRNSTKTGSGKSRGPLQPISKDQCVRSGNPLKKPNPYNIKHNIVADKENTLPSIPNRTNNDCNAGKIISGRFLQIDPKSLPNSMFNSTIMYNGSLIKSSAIKSKVMLQINQHALNDEAI